MISPTSCGPPDPDTHALGHAAGAGGPATFPHTAMAGRDARPTAGTPNGAAAGLRDRIAASADGAGDVLEDVAPPSALLAATTNGAVEGSSGVREGLATKARPRSSVVTFFGREWSPFDVSQAIASINPPLEVLPIDWKYPGSVSEVQNKSEQRLVKHAHASQQLFCCRCLYVTLNLFCLGRPDHGSRN